MLRDLVEGWPLLAWPDKALTILEGVVGVLFFAYGLIVLLVQGIGPNAWFAALGPLWAVAGFYHGVAHVRRVRSQRALDQTLANLEEYLTHKRAGFNAPEGE